MSTAASRRQVLAELTTGRRSKSSRSGWRIARVVFGGLAGVLLLLALGAGYWWWSSVNDPRTCGRWPGCRLAVCCLLVCSSRWTTSLRRLPPSGRLFSISTFIRWRRCGPPSPETVRGRGVLPRCGAATKATETSGGSGSSTAQRLSNEPAGRNIATQLTSDATSSASETRGEGNLLKHLLPSLTAAVSVVKSRSCQPFEAAGDLPQESWHVSVVGSL
jgi:hypothetical protein